MASAYPLSCYTYFILCPQLTFYFRALPATIQRRCLLVRPNAVRYQPWSAEIHLRFPVARDHVLTHKFGLPFRIITVHKLVVMSYADGSGGPLALRTSPLASGLPLTCEAFPLAGAALPLTCRAAPANPSTFAALTTPGGLRSLRSASSLSFLVILLPQNNSLTFVRGADRAYCAPRKWLWRPTFACLCQTPRDPEGRGARTRQRHLAARRRASPPKGHWRACPAAAPCRT